MTPSSNLAVFHYMRRFSVEAWRSPHGFRPIWVSRRLNFDIYYWRSMSTEQDGLMSVAPAISGPSFCLTARHAHQQAGSRVEMRMEKTGGERGTDRRADYR